MAVRRLGNVLVNVPHVSFIFKEVADLVRDTRSRKDSTTATPKGLRIGRTRVGKGVFALKTILPGAMIGEIEGEMIDDPEYTSNYAIDVEDGRQFEPAAPFRFVNHCCNPNCEFDFFDLPHVGVDEKQRRVFLFALREIAAGDELTIDYNWPPTYAIPCRCGSVVCRGWIVRPSRMDELHALLKSTPD